jgi:UDPglucose--hexose-1-phosphate uridylyltransferase
MAELRWHPFLQEWVITAPHRQNRTFLPPPEYCPLCPTKANSIATEIPFENYEIVVFENRFPSLTSTPPATSCEAINTSEVKKSFGVCEVVCYTENHNAKFSDLNRKQVLKIMTVWQDRYKSLKKLPFTKYIYIFENKGEEIGVTLSHPHGQIYAYPFIPNAIKTRIHSERSYYQSTGRHLTVDWLKAELTDQKRIVWENPHWAIVVPFFARWPYELHIAPKESFPDLTQMEDRVQEPLSEALLQASKRLDNVLGMPMPYIMSLFQFPDPKTTFRIEFTPLYRDIGKLKYLAGSESGCGVFINDVRPEDAAAKLRNL